MSEYDQVLGERQTLGAMLERTNVVPTDLTTLPYVTEGIYLHRFPVAGKMPVVAWIQYLGPDERIVNLYFDYEIESKNRSRVSAV